MRMLLRSLLPLPVVCLAIGTLWAANDPFVGKWKDLPAVGFFHRDRQGGSAHSWLVSPVGYDGVDCIGTKGEGIFALTRGLNLHFVGEFALRGVHLPFAHEWIVSRPSRADSQTNNRQ